MAKQATGKGRGKVRGDLPKPSKPSKQAEEAPVLKPDPIETALERVWKFIAGNPLIVVAALVVVVVVIIVVAISMKKTADPASAPLTEAHFALKDIKKDLTEENTKKKEEQRLGADDLDALILERGIEELRRLHAENRGKPGEAFVALRLATELQNSPPPDDPATFLKRLDEAAALLSSTAITGRGEKDAVAMEAARLGRIIKDTRSWLEKEQAAGRVPLGKASPLSPAGIASRTAAVPARTPLVAVQTSGGHFLVLELDARKYPRASGWFLSLVKTGALAGTSFFDRSQVVSRRPAQGEPITKKIAVRFGAPFETGNRVDNADQSDAAANADKDNDAAPADNWPREREKKTDAPYVIPDAVPENNGVTKGDRGARGALAVCRSYMARGGKEFILFENAEYQLGYRRNYLFFGRVWSGASGDIEVGEKIVQAWVSRRSDLKTPVEYVSPALVAGAKDAGEKQRLQNALDDITGNILVLPRVVMTTNRGEIELELFEDEAPNTVANFLWLSRHPSADSDKDGAFYRGVLFHRTDGQDYVDAMVEHTGADEAEVKAPPMIQFGDPSASGSGGVQYHLPREYSWRRHGKAGGRLAVASSGEDLNPSGSQAYITRGDCTHLDGTRSSHIVFGRVLRGMDVVRKIRAFDEILELKVTRERTSHDDDGITRQW